MQVWRIAAFKRGVRAILGVESVDVRFFIAPVQTVEQALIKRNLHTTGHALTAAAPLHVALKIGADQRLARFSPAPAQKHQIAIRRGIVREAVIAAPIFFAGLAIPRCLARVAGSAFK